MILPTQNLLDFFIGHWQLQKKAGEHDQWLGWAIFEPISSCTNELLYTENGRLILSSGKTYNSQRSYIYQFNHTHANIFFAEDNLKKDLFLKLNFPSTQFNLPMQTFAEHTCKDDYYRAHFKLVSTNEFFIHYSVSGPRKDYRIENKYSRQQKVNK